MSTALLKFRDAQYVAGLRRTPVVMGLALTALNDLLARRHHALEHSAVATATSRWIPEVQQIAVSRVLTNHEVAPERHELAHVVADVHIACAAAVGVVDQHMMDKRCAHLPRALLRLACSAVGVTHSSPLKWTSALDALSRLIAHERSESPLVWSAEQRDLCFAAVSATMLRDGQPLDAVLGASPSRAFADAVAAVSESKSSAATHAPASAALAARIHLVQQGSAAWHVAARLLGACSLRRAADADLMTAVAVAAAAQGELQPATRLLSVHEANKAQSVLSPSVMAMQVLRATCSSLLVDGPAGSSASRPEGAAALLRLGAACSSPQEFSFVRASASVSLLHLAMQRALPDWRTSLGLLTCVPEMRRIREGYLDRLQRQLPFAGARELAGEIVSKKQEQEQRVSLSLSSSCSTPPQRHRRDVTTEIFCFDSWATSFASATPGPSYFVMDPKTLLPLPLWHSALATAAQALRAAPSELPARSHAALLATALVHTAKVGRHRTAVEVMQLLAERVDAAASSSSSSSPPSSAAVAAGDVSPAAALSGSAAVRSTGMWFLALDALTVVTAAAAAIPAAKAASLLAHVSTDLLAAAVRGERWDYALRLSGELARARAAPITAASAFSIARLAPASHWQRCLQVAVEHRRLAGRQDAVTLFDRESGAEERETLKAWLMLVARHDSGHLPLHIARLRSRFPAFEFYLPMLRGRVALAGDWETALTLRSPGGGALPPLDSTSWHERGTETAAGVFDCLHNAVRAMNRCAAQRLPSQQRGQAVLLSAADAMLGRLPDANTTRNTRIDADLSSPLVDVSLLLRVAQRLGGTVSLAVAKHILERLRRTDAVSTLGSFEWCAAVLCLIAMCGRDRSSMAELLQLLRGGATHGRGSGSDGAIRIDLSPPTLKDDSAGRSRRKSARWHPMLRQTIAAIFEAAARGVLQARALTLTTPAVPSFTRDSSAPMQAALDIFGSVHEEWLHACSVAFIVDGALASTWEREGAAASCSAGEESGSRPASPKRENRSLLLRWVAPESVSRSLRIIQGSNVAAGTHQRLILWKPAGLSLNDCAYEINKRRARGGGSDASVAPLVSPFHVPRGASGLAVLHDVRGGEMVGTVRLAAVITAIADGDEDIASEDVDDDSPPPPARTADREYILSHFDPSAIELCRQVKMSAVSLAGRKAGSALPRTKRGDIFVKFEIDVGPGDSDLDAARQTRRQDGGFVAGFRAIDLFFEKLRRERLAPVRNDKETSHAAIFVRGVSLRSVQLDGRSSDKWSYDCGLTRSFLKEFGLI